MATAALAPVRIPSLFALRDAWRDAVAEWVKAGKPARRYPAYYPTPALARWYGIAARLFQALDVCGPMGVSRGL